MDPVVNRWSGEVDLWTVEPLRRRFLADLDRGCDVVLDLGSVTFFDCSAVGVLVAGAHRARELHRSFSLVRVPARVADLLRLTRVDTLFAG